MAGPKAPILVLWLLLGIALAAPAVAEDGVPPDEGGFVESMGQPPRLIPYAGL
jgi:hypothetical protein